MEAEPRDDDVSDASQEDDGGDGGGWIPDEAVKGDEQGNMDSGEENAGDDQEEVNEERERYENEVAEDEEGEEANRWSRGYSLAVEDTGDQEEENERPLELPHSRTAYTALLPDWTFPRHIGDSLRNETKGRVQLSTSDMGKVGAMSFGFPGPFRLGFLGGEGLGSGGLHANPSLLLPTGGGRRFKPQRESSVLSDMYSIGSTDHERTVATMVRLPSVKTLPRQRVVQPSETYLNRKAAGAMITYHEITRKTEYVPRDLIETFAKEASQHDIQTRRFDPSLGPLLDLTENVPHHGLQSLESELAEAMEVEEDDWVSMRAQTPALSHVPDLSDWQSWVWAAYASGDGFGDVFLSPYFFGNNAQLENRIIPVPYFTATSRVRQLSWTEYPNQAPRLLLRDQTSINLLDTISLAPLPLIKLYNQAHSSLSDRRTRFSKRPPFGKPGIANWKFETDLPVDCDWNRWVAGEVVAMTASGKVIFRDMDALGIKASLVGTFVDGAAGASVTERWKSVRYARDHPRVVSIAFDRQLGWADIRCPDTFRHHTLFETTADDPIHSFAQTKTGLSVAATEKRIVLLDRRMPGRDLVSWSHHFGNGEANGSFSQLDVVDVPGHSGGDSETWIVASNRRRSDALVIPIRPTPGAGSSPVFSSTPFTVNGYPIDMDPLRDHLPTYTLRGNPQKDYMDRKKMVMGTSARFFPRGRNVLDEDEVATGDRLVVWQLSEDGSVWCSGVAFGESSGVWSGLGEHVKTEDEFLVEEEATVDGATWAEAKSQHWIRSHQNVNLSSFLKFSLDSIAKSQIGQETDADHGTQAGSTDRPYSLYSLQPREPAVYGPDGKFVRPARTTIAVRQRNDYVLPSKQHRLWTPDRPAWLRGIDLEHPYTVWEDLASKYLHPAVKEMEETLEREAEETGEEVSEEQGLGFARALRTESVNKLAGDLFLGGSIVFPPIQLAHDDPGPDEDDEVGYRTPILPEPVQLSAAAQHLRTLWNVEKKYKFKPIKVDPRTKRLRQNARRLEEEMGIASEDDEEEEEETGDELESLVEDIEEAPWSQSKKRRSRTPTAGRSASVVAPRVGGSQPPRANSVFTVRSTSVGPASQRAPSVAPSQSMSQRAASQAPGPWQPDVSQLIDSYLSSQPMGTQGTATSTRAVNPNKKPRRSGF